MKQKRYKPYYTVTRARFRSIITQARWELAFVPEQVEDEKLWRGMMAAYTLYLVRKGKLCVM